MRIDEDTLVKYVGLNFYFSGDTMYARSKMDNIFPLHVRIKLLHVASIGQFMVAAAQPCSLSVYEIVLPTSAVH
jgi:hypothetical protein